MKITNVHKRIINQPIERVSELITKLATKDDVIWPYEKWPAIKFKEGLKVGSKGGHGLIRYTITKYDPSRSITFQFTKPNGFNGIHEFKLDELSYNQTEINHTIDVDTSFAATIQWFLFIRWLHDALIEDALDKVENHFSEIEKKTEWSIYVKFWRWILASQTKKYPKASYN